MLSHLQDHAITIEALIQEHKFLIKQINDVIEKALFLFSSLPNKILFYNIQLIYSKSRHALYQNQRHNF